MRPSNEVFARAARKAAKKCGFAATATTADGLPWVEGDIEDNFYGFPIPIKIVRRIRKPEWDQFVKALANELPSENKPDGPPKGRYRYYEVELLPRKGSN